MDLSAVNQLGNWLAPDHFAHLKHKKGVCNKDLTQK
jgi:hypothetical protein